MFSYLTSTELDVSKYLALSGIVPFEPATTLLFIEYIASFFTKVLI
ncbi:hypothetical protein ONV75_16065 [Clostridium sp. LQ25]|nr:hypothetical protein [Clostridium sp. LQ25]UZT06096.1 hypothetical protein ONV75_16065 [Clostridium sp. LQ25]